MKIVRLTTTDNNALFDNEFQSGLTLKPNSKIALQNLVCESVNNTLSINEGNDKIEYQLKDADLNEIKLTHGNFSKSNVNSLFSDIQKKMNANLQNVANELGVEWKVEENQDQKVSIQYKRGTYSRFKDSWVLNNTTTGSNNFRSTSGSDTATNENNMYLTKIMCRGSGIFRANIKTLISSASPDDNQGFIMGLVSTNPDGKTIIPDSDVKFGLHARTTTSGYVKIVDGVRTVLATNPTVNDITELAIEEGKLVCRIYNTTTPNYPGTVLFEETYNGTSNYYPLLVFRGQETNAIIDTSFIETPFEPTTIENNLIEDFGVSIPIPAPQPSKNFLEFKGVSLARFLGFNNLRIPVSGTIFKNEVDYIANVKFEPTDISDTFLIEALNLKLDSYDGFSSERRNILSVVPASDETNRILYDSSYPVFIDLNNRNDIELRNLRFRLLKNDLSPITIRGLAIMTILIQDGN